MCSVHKIMAEKTDFSKKILGNICQINAKLQKSLQLNLEFLAFLVHTNPAILLAKLKICQKILQEFASNKNKKNSQPLSGSDKAKSVSTIFLCPAVYFRRRENTWINIKVIEKIAKN